MFLERGARQNNKENSYSGIAIENLPPGFRDRVQSAVEVARGTGNRLKLWEVADAGWKFGAYTDVLVFHRDNIVYTYHQSDRRTFCVSIKGNVEDAASKIYDVVGAFGFIPEKIDKIPGFGWIEREKTSWLTRLTTFSGPYYGMKIKPPEEK